MATVRCDAPEPSLGGRYRILKQLGAGASSIVFAAFDCQMRRAIALKLLCPGFGLQALREARVMASVSHPNVVEVYDSGTIRDAAYLTMELIRGTTLREWAQKPQSVSDVVKAMIAAGRGLAAAHGAGVLHRDFKPANVLIDRHGNVKVADFGLAARAPGRVAEGTDSVMDPSVDMAAAMTGTGSGTGPYMSPEEALCNTVDARSDQFSFCATLYELVAGERLIPIGTAADAPAGLIEVQLDRVRRSVSRRLLRVLTRGLSFDPSARYATMNQLLDDLSGAASRAPRLRLA